MIKVYTYEEKLYASYTGDLKVEKKKKPSCSKNHYMQEKE